MLDPRSVVLTGATGLLGTAFRAALALEEDRCLGRSDLNVRDAATLWTRLSGLRPGLVIHCAADTDVEGAEAHPERAFATNAMLPGLLAQACRRLGVPLVHFSSTGCYGAFKSTPYDDFDDLRPTTVHHRSKAAGETEVRQSGCESLILRLGWMYGGGRFHRKNFVWARIQEARSKPEVFSDPFQTGVPTLADDVVAQTLVLIQAGVRGTFNCVAGGATSRFDYVQAIVDAAGLDTRLRPRRFSRAAPVSPNEAAVNLKLDLLGLNRMTPWNEALASYVARLLLDERQA